MSKITRRSYKRKKILMGAALFGAVGLVSTGFAAWVLSASASNTQNPNLKVGSVSDKSMGFQNMKIYGLNTAAIATKDELIELATADANFSFNPRIDDTTGRVRFGSNEGADIGERLTLKISGEVTEAQNLGSLTVKFDSIPDKLAEAVTKEYVVLPDCASVAQDVAHIESTVGGVQIASFEYEVTFAWGDAFDNENPADYYENGHAGQNVAIDDVHATLDDLHDLLDDVTIQVTFVAEPN